MTRERLYLYDTTLRDGAQTQGVDFSLEDKWLIAQQLDVLGIDYIEAGYPGANPTDTQALRRRRRSSARAKLTAFGMTKRPGRSLAERSGLPGGARGEGAGHLPRRQDLGLPCRCGARHQPRGESRKPSRSRSRPSSPRGARRCSTASISSTATRPIPITRLPAPRRPTRPARAGWCCATPMAARCPRRSRGSSAEVVQAHPRRPSRHPCA